VPYAPANGPHEEKQTEYSGHFGDGGGGICVTQQIEVRQSKETWPDRSAVPWVAAVNEGPISAYQPQEPNMNDPECTSEQE
jgi:hypothetical protein